MGVKQRRRKRFVCPGCHKSLAGWTSLKSHIAYLECSYGEAMAIKYPVPPRVETATQLTVRYTGESEKRLKEVCQLASKHGGDSALKWNSGGQSNAVFVFAEVIGAMKFILELPDGVFVVDAKEAS